MLDLTGNDFPFEEDQHLHHLLKDPRCKLKQLKWGCGMSTAPRGTFKKVYQVRRFHLSAEPSSSSSSRSSDAAELHLAQLFSTHTPTLDGSSDAMQSGCKCCAEVPDTSHWILVEPEVSTEKNISIYSLSSAAGSYECSESSLRWSCVGPVTLQYRFMDWQIFAEELAQMQCSPAGPLMDIKLISGELEELEDIHLPHFLCLGGSQSALMDAVKVLHQQNGGVCLETRELSRSHARLLKPSLSILGVVKYMTSFLFPEKENKMEIHTCVDVYRSSILPLTFHVYLMPKNAHLKKLVEEQEKLKEFGGIRLGMPSPVECLQLNQLYALQTDCDSTILPPKLKLEMARNLDVTPNFSEVRPKKAGDFRVMLLSSADSREVKKEVWQAEILGIECCPPHQGTVQTSSGGPVSSLPCGVDATDTHTAVDQFMGCQDVQTSECSTSVLQTDTVLDWLFSALDHLESDQLKRFKAYLSEKGTLESCVPIPKGQLEQYNETDLAS
ncbi:NACHT, LRR and PYD domains-containing protein 1 homolog [Engraulis encrasicolus]|uniref:NACHT, LRR and PYD domains-containing protein 1 homolog n=1 Tax=Engraulis encrasicolus TaxID=184585 RepID=UPI002FD2911F